MAEIMPPDVSKASSKYDNDRGCSIEPKALTKLIQFCINADLSDEDVQDITEHIEVRCAHADGQALDESTIDEIEDSYKEREKAMGAEYEEKKEGTPEEEEGEEGKEEDEEGNEEDEDKVEE